MKVIIVPNLKAIPEELIDYLKNLDFDQFPPLDRLLVCLYFLSDLDDESLHLNEIEMNLRFLYHQSYIESLVDFQSSNIRGKLNTDKNKPDPERYFKHLEENLGRKGYWRNSQHGNRTALEVLNRNNITLRIGIDDPDYVIYEKNSIDSNKDFQIVNNGDDVEYIDSKFKKRTEQSIFRLKLIEAYNGKCCITGESCLVVLEAAHIQSYLNSDSNHVQNGLLLRMDFHKLYDNGLMYIDENYKVKISSLIESEYYKKFNGLKLCLPEDKDKHPSIEALLLKKEYFKE